MSIPDRQIQGIFGRVHSADFRPDGPSDLKKCVWPRTKLVSSGFSIFTVTSYMVWSLLSSLLGGAANPSVFYPDAGKGHSRP
jgi:hypothetical protein